MAGQSAEIGNDLYSREKIGISILPLGEYISQQVWIAADYTKTKKMIDAIVIYRSVRSALA